MTRWTLMMLRAYFPAALLMGMACLLLGAWWLIQTSTFLVAFEAPLRWAISAALAASVGAAVVAGVALWRWEQGRTQVCGCGGLLGFERAGRWGPYKRCLACNRTHKVAL